MSRSIKDIEKDIRSLKNTISELNMMGSEAVYSQEDMLALYMELDEANNT